MIFHELNRRNARDRIFADDADDAAIENAAFEKVLAETQAEVFLRLRSDCLTPNYWHLVLWPLQEGDLGRFLKRFTTTHVRLGHLHHHSVGTGHLYQGTYKSFPIEERVMATGNRQTNRTRIPMSPPRTTEKGNR